MSKPKKKHPIRNRFIPRLGRLEDRWVPAGNVAALVGDGILYVVGDDLANKIWIAGQGGTRVTIMSADGTTLINGQASVSFDDVDGGFHLVMNGGGDAVSISGVDAIRNLNIDLGAGDDGIMMVDVRSWRNTNLFTGPGNDAIMTNVSAFHRNMVIDGGDGNDLYELKTSFFGGDTFLNGGAGGNLLERSTSFFENEPIVAGFDTFVPPTPPPTQAPIANNDTGTVARGGTVSINVAANDVAQVGSLNLNSVTITRNPMFGTVSVTGGGSVSYTANNTATSSVDSFQYTITDTNGTVSNVATVSITIRDTTSPTVTVSTTATDPTSVSPIIFNIDFSEDVAMLDSTDITVVNGTVGLLSALSARAYRVEIDPTADGDVSVSLAAGVVNDLSGNPNIASNVVTITFNTSDPTITINPLTTNDTTPTITGTVTAGSTVSVTVDGQTIAATVTGTTWSATVPTALADGTFTIMATATLNGNTTDSTLTDGLVIDTVVPTVAITTTATDPTNLPVVPFTVTFSEAVTGFDETGLTIVNGTVSNFVAVSATVYTFDVTPAADGLMTVTVEAGAATDAAGNTNAETSFSITVAGVPPTPVITSTEPSPTSANPIPFTVTFNEDVTGFDATDLMVTNGTVGNFVAVDARTYTFEVTPAADGDVVIDIAAGAAQDLSGNDSLAATFTITSDSSVPTLTITTTAPDPTNLASLPFTVTFSEDVTGFDETDITVINGTVSNFVAVDARTYTFDVAPSDNGLLTVTVAADAGQDGAGNGNAETTFTITVAGLQPTPVITTTATDPTNLGTIPFTVTFNIPVTGFDASDIGVTNGTLSNFVAVNNRTFTFDVAPLADGTVMVNIAAGAAQAVSDGTQSVAATFSIVSDTTAPVAPTITNIIPQNGQSLTNSRRPTVIGTAEAGTTVEVFADSGAGPVSLGTTTADAGGNFSLDPTVDLADGTYNLTATTTDAAGNVSPVSNAFTIFVDATAPTVTLTTTASNPTNLAAIPFTATFSEDVTGFTEAELSILNGSVANFVAVDARTYTFDVVPNGDGVVTVGVEGGAGQDPAGNGSEPTLFTIVSERNSPTASISTTATDPTNLVPIPFTVLFSEPVTGFDLTDITVLNGTPSNFVAAADGRTYTFDVTAAGDGTVTVTVAAGAAMDSAGNTNPATSFSILFDSGLPVAPVILGLDPADDFGLQGDGRTNIPSPRITGTAEAGTTVTLMADSGSGPVTIGTATAGAGGSWSIAPTTPLADGTYTVTATATDTGGNVSPASAPFTLIIDTVAPVPTFSSAATNPTNASPIIVTLVFSKETFGFDLTDLTVTNGTVSNLMSTNAANYSFELIPTADGTVTIDMAAGAGADISGNASAAGSFSIVSDRTLPTGTINPTSAQSITGTAADATSGVAGVRISIFNGTFYWDGTSFASSTEIFFDASSTDNFATWNFAFNTPGTYTVNAQIRDVAGNSFSVQSQVIVT